MSSVRGFQGESSLTIAGGEVGRYRWVVLGAMVAGSWAMTLPALSLGLLLPAINESLHLTPLQVGWLGSSLRLGTVFLTVPAAIVLTRFHPLRLMLLSLAITAVLAVAHGLAPIFAVLLLARLGLGIGYALRTPAVSVLSQQWFPLKEIPMVNGIIVGLNGVAEAWKKEFVPYGTPCSELYDPATQKLEIMRCELETMRRRLDELLAERAAERRPEQRDRA